MRAVHVGWAGATRKRTYEEDEGEPLEARFVHGAKVERGIVKDGLARAVELRELARRELLLLKDVCGARSARSGARQHAFWRGRKEAGVGGWVGGVGGGGVW